MSGPIMPRRDWRVSILLRAERAVWRCTNAAHGLAGRIGSVGHRLYRLRSRLEYPDGEPPLPFEEGAS